MLKLKNPSLHSRKKYLIISFFFAIVNVGAIYSQTITVLAPNGNEILSYGSNYNITWSTTGGITSVDIDYSINGGVNWTTIVTGVPSSGGGSYSWAVPNLPTTEGLVRVKKNSTSDVSNSVFFIKSPQFNPNNPVKILPLGNSITYDQFRAELRFAQDKISYRYTLWDSLRSNNYNTDFIGHKLGGYYQFPDPESGGIPGISSLGMYNFLNTGYDPVTQTQVTASNYLNVYSPNVVLLHIGTNGVTDPGGTDTTNVRNILNLIKSKDSTTWVIVALIIDFVPNEPLVTTYNNNLKSMIRTRQKNGDKLLLVDMQNNAGLIYGIDSIPPFTADMFDQLHPNDSGKVKMGKLWYKALQLILPSVPTSVPSFTTSPDTVGYVNFPYRYKAHADGSGFPLYSLTTAPLGMTINSKTGIVSWVPNSPGIYNVEITASNSSGSSMQSFSIQVNPTPFTVSNLISYWRVNDPLSAGNPGTIEDLPGVNNGFCSNCPASVTGIEGKAINFDLNAFNNNETIKVLDDSSLYFSSSSFTFETWVKTGQSNSILIGKYSDPDNMEVRLAVDGNGKARFFARSTKPNSQTNAIADSITSTSTVNNNAWHHVVGVVDRDSNKIKIYVDGNKNSKTVNYSTQKFFSVDPLTIGSMKNTNFFNGSLDEIAIYKRALTDAEVNQHYLKGIYYSKGYFDQFVLAKLKIFLEGPFVTNGDSMKTTLRVNNYIPLTSPYPQDPRTLSSIPFGIVDWVLVELRSQLNGGTIGYKSALLKSDGKIVGDDGVTEEIVVDVPPGNYYVVIRHRNHLSVMSKNPIALNDNSSAPSLYDFTSSSNNYYGTGGVKELKPGVWGMWAGDVNGDGVIKYNLANNDRALILQRIGGSDINAAVSGYYPEDLNLDGTVKYNLTNNDRAMILVNLGGDNINATKQTQVP